MLARFEVENFRGFERRIVVDFKAGDYEYMPELVRNGYVQRALLYGANGVGKSSLGMALFDINRHLTDVAHLKNDDLNPYVNLNSQDGSVSFKYEFDFQEAGKLTYAYEKSGPDTLVHESLWFGDVLAIDWNYKNGEGNVFRTDLVGVVNLEKRPANVSVLKYVYRTTGSTGNALVARLMKFVEHMLWYRNLLGGPRYAGFFDQVEDITDEIKKQNKLADYVKFLADNGLHYDLEFAPLNGRDELFAKFNGGKALFTTVASAGTLSLTLFFYWSIVAFGSVSFLFIDEFDAFIHYASARAILERLNAAGDFQAMVTTHNTYLMQNSLTRPDCCFIMGENGVKPLCKATDKEIRQAHNLEKMYTHGAFNE